MKTARISFRAPVDVAGRVDHLEQRRALEVARSEVSVDRKDRSSDQRKRVCHQARANKSRGAFRQRGPRRQTRGQAQQLPRKRPRMRQRSEEHTSELQSHHDLVCRLLLEKKKENTT